MLILEMRNEAGDLARRRRVTRSCWAWRIGCGFLTYRRAACWPARSVVDLLAAVIEFAFGEQHGSGELLLKAGSSERSTCAVRRPSCSASSRSEAESRASLAPSEAALPMKWMRSSGIEGRSPMRRALARRMKLRRRRRAGCREVSDGQAGILEQDRDSGANGAGRQLQFAHVALAQRDRRAVAGIVRMGEHEFGTVARPAQSRAQRVGVPAGASGPTGCGRSIRAGRCAGARRPRR